MIGVILAAGRGERLRPLTDDLPKGLITLNSQTLLEYSLTARDSPDPVDCILLNNLLWTDIDTNEDFERAKEILPKIVKNIDHKLHKPT